MNKLAILGLPVLALIGLTACNPDTDPKIDTSRDFEFKLNTPQFASQFIDLSTDGTIEFTVSQPDYGVTVSPTYGLEISLKEDFSPVTEEPVTDSEGEEHVVPGFYTLTLESQQMGVLVAKMADMAAGINVLNGVFDESTYTGDYEGPVYVRATAYLGSGSSASATAVYSNVIKLDDVQGYASFGGGDDVLLLSVPGGANGWTHPGQVLYVGDTEDGSAMKFQGFAVIDGEFKVTDGDWDGSGNWGAAEGTGLTANADGTFSANLVQNGGNFNSDQAAPSGLYYIYVEITDFENGNDNAVVGKVTITPITSVTLPGDYNGWNVEENPLTPNSENPAIWSGSSNVTAAGWKFAMNKDWAINLGGSIDELSFDGANITLDGSNITLNLEAYPWTCTVE